MATLKPSAGSLQIGLNERRLRYFAAAVSTGSIRGAADRFNIEPSVVSRQIQQFEAELGVTLFERRGRGVVPTEAAMLVMEHYRERLTGEETLLTQLEELNGLQRGQIHIVTGEGFVDALVTRVLTEFCREFPKVHVTLELLNVAGVVQQVVEDRASIGLAYASAVHPDARALVTKRLPLCVVMAPSHPLAGHEGPLSLHQLLPYPVGLMAPGFGLRNLVQMAEFTEKLKFTAGFTSTSIAALRCYALSGSGIALMPVISAPRELFSGELIAMHTRNRIFENAQAQLIVRDKRPRSAAMNVLIARMSSMTGGLWAGVETGTLRK